MTEIFDRLGLRRLINVSGTETAYGGAPVCREVIDAVVEIVPHSVDMAELQSSASAVIARAVGTTAGCVTGCTAASIAISVAACMTGRDLGRVEQLPDTSGMKDEVVLQKGHEVTYGQRVSQNIRLTGAKVVEIGVATQCGAYQLRHALSPRTAAALYIISHLTAPNRMIDLETFCQIAHECGVPVIVDAASMSDPRVYVDAGADLVLFSAHKAFASITAGVVAGPLELVQACIYQEYGIGRPMKVGKEGVAGAIVALERWMAEDRKAKERELAVRLARAKATLDGIDGVAVSHQRSQLRLHVDASTARLSASEAADVLRAHDPSIVVWSQLARDGVLLLTLGKVTDETAQYVTDRIRHVFATATARSVGKPPNLADAIVTQLEAWPSATARAAPSVKQV